MNCEALSEKLLEFALGNLSGRDRSMVLDHVDSCSRCRIELESLAAVTDAMLLLAPEVEPPWGFESRLLGKLRTTDAVPATSRRLRAGALLVAALLLVVAGFGIGATLNRNGSSTHYATSSPLTGRLTSNGKTLGQVFISSGHPAWIYMALDDANISGVARCEVTLKSGRVESVGHFAVSHGYGAWTAALRGTAGEVRSAQLVNKNGTVIASAVLHA